jgi:hypothetical protein
VVEVLLEERASAGANVVAAANRVSQAAGVTVDRHSQRTILRAEVLVDEAVIHSGKAGDLADLICSALRSASSSVTACLSAASTSVLPWGAESLEYFGIRTLRFACQF